MDEFDERNERMIRAMASDPDQRDRTREWFTGASRYEYSYHFTWLGRPIIQFPQDMIAVQEIIWRVRPSVIVETGIARGGSLVFSASILEMLGGEGRVVGVDIDIRAQNRIEIERHPLAGRITMIEGSSIDVAVAARVVELARGAVRALVLLDSNHTHEHVLRELELYSPLVGSGSYVIVFDTIIEDLPGDVLADRPWGRGNNPKTAVREFLRRNDRFEIDRDIESKLLITVAPGGYLRCVKD
jgi:cephalosporin hydroxylase